MGRLFGRDARVSLGDERGSIKPSRQAVTVYRPRPSSWRARDDRGRFVPAPMVEVVFMAQGIARTEVTEG